MLVYPEIDPVILPIWGPFQLRWYGLMYLLAFGSAWLLGSWRARSDRNTWTRQEVGDLIFLVAICAIIGGRVGYMLFYDFQTFISAPWRIVMLAQGGMSFHGGLIGAILGLAWHGRRRGRSFFEVSDFAAPLVPLGLGFGRIGNFINGNLWGRPTDLPWGMVFPHVDAQPRHPSQLYQALLEGLALFIILWWFSAKPRPRMAVSGLFLLGYGVFRFAVEFVRVPDSQLGYLAFDWLTMGQVLSLPLIILGAMFMTLAYRRRNAEEQTA